MNPNLSQVVSAFLLRVNSTLPSRNSVKADSFVV
jgi:hypothetical protein